MGENTKIEGEDYFYTWEEADDFFYEFYEEIEEHINCHGSSHFVGFFSSYINKRSQTEDIPSIHSDMASMVWDIYHENKEEN